MPRITSSERLADAILSQFAGPAAFISRVPTPSPAPAPRPVSKHAPKGEQIDIALRDLCSKQQPGQTFSHQQIADHCGCHHKLIQIIEKRAYYKFARRLLEIDPELVQENLGDHVTLADVLRVHHPESTKVSARRGSEFDSRLRRRRFLAGRDAQMARVEAKAGLPGVYEVSKILAAREGRRPYGRRPTQEQLAEIRAERMRRNKEGVCVSQ